MVAGVSISILSLDLSKILPGRWRHKHSTKDIDVYPCTLKEFPRIFRGKQYGAPPEVAMVWGTTRHKQSRCKHPGFVSDAIYVPEIALGLHSINSRAVFASYLDVDITDDMLNSMNFLLFGDGEVNGITYRLLDLVQQRSRIPLRAASSPFFGSTTSRRQHHMLGVVHLLSNPWNSERFVLVMGGVGPLGTIGVLKWLSESIINVELLPQSSAVVLRSEEKEYAPKYDGYRTLCPECCRAGRGRGIHWEGKISNVTCTIREEQIERQQVRPKDAEDPAADS